MEFFKSTTGRLLLLSIAVTFILGGASALMHHGAESAALYALSLFLPIVINMIGLPRALENDWYHAAISIAVLPLLFFLWAVGSGVIREHHPELAWPVVVAGVVVLALAARPSQATVVAHAPAHAHG
jgi:hypothetical protein